MRKRACQRVGPGMIPQRQVSGLQTGITRARDDSLGTGGFPPNTTDSKQISPEHSHPIL